MSLLKLPEVRAFRHSDALAFEAPSDNVNAFDPTLVAASADDAVISIYGQIGIDPYSAVDNSERRIAGALRSIGPRDIEVYVNSPGGNFFSGLAIYNLLRAHPAKVTINIIAMAGSAASVIAMAGDDILMADGSFLMVHNASGVIIGNKYDTEAASELLAEIDDAMAEIYSARAGVDKAKAAAWMDRRRGDGTMFNTGSAISEGLATGKLEPEKVKVSADAKKHIPAERVVENALMRSCNMSPARAKACVSEMKSGTRDAPDPNVTRDADDLVALIEGLRSTIRS
ncbi:head maturation protease, ClpP-related [Falsirhodobacter halotolerans]|uniref:head maturation protease, ClpP-related n=1 Tax=Falsirhodobacter halotolerans TaxID=1146892 RepID=UPI001FD408DA|nr:head maturation protease, ClpP-related [Falsirhodobacter halotolerans]MCJ8139572.1 Clp protease ClpP [Falsirhodobacter halotolerans]